MSAEEILERARQLVAEQAEDEGLWFVAESITEAYFQERLRALHAVIESSAPVADGRGMTAVEILEGKALPPVIDTSVECPHQDGYSRICGQCASRLRAEGFQKGYVKGLEDGRVHERLGMA